MTIWGAAEGGISTFLLDFGGAKATQPRVLASALTHKAEARIVQIRKRKFLSTTADGLVRFNTYSLYDAGALYGEVIDVCRRMLQAKEKTPTEKSETW